MPRPRTRETKYTRYHDTLREMRVQSYELDSQLGLSVSGTLWRPDEDELILARLDGMGAEHLSKLLGRTPSAIRRRAKVLRGRALRTRGPVWTPEEDELILENYPHLMDARQIGVQINRTPQQVYSRVSRLQREGRLDPEDLLERKREVAQRVRREV